MACNWYNGAIEPAHLFDDLEYDKWTKKGAYSNLLIPNLLAILVFLSSVYRSLQMMTANLQYYYKIEHQLFFILAIAIRVKRNAKGYQQAQTGLIRISQTIFLIYCQFTMKNTIKLWMSTPFITKAKETFDIL